MTLHNNYMYYTSSASDDTAGTTLSSQFHSAILDTDFLLRAALTHDWDTLVSFCQFLEEIFTLSVPDRVLEWQQNRIVAATHQLTAKDQWGNTALHSACYNLPPARVVRALLQAASAATPEPLQIHTTLSRDQSTPLLVACATGASVEVIQALLDPPAGLVAGGAMVCLADQQGSTPLTELAVHYELQRKSPMHVHTSRPLDQVQSLIRATTNDTLLDTFQTKLELLLQAAWTHSFPSQSMISIVHGLANVAASCPPVVTRLVLRGYPHMISFTDRQGVLPLHLTVSQPILGGANTTFNSLARHATCVEGLLEAYPFAARMEMPTRTRRRKRRTPFVQAIASGCCYWHTSSRTNNNKPLGPLQLLYRAAPESLSRVDPLTGLYPAMLAATTFFATTTNDSSSTQQQVQEQILQVDTIYNLLRLHPQVLEELVW